MLDKRQYIEETKGIMEENTRKVTAAMMALDSIHKGEPNDPNLTNKRKLLHVKLCVCTLR